MNKVYKLIFNNITGRWCVASELAKGKSTGQLRTGLIGLMLLLPLNVVLAQSTCSGVGALACDLNSPLPYTPAISGPFTQIDIYNKTITGTGTVNLNSNHNVMGGTGIQFHTEAGNKNGVMNLLEISVNAALGTAVNVDAEFGDNFTINGQAGSPISIFSQNSHGVYIDGKNNVGVGSTYTITMVDAEIETRSNDSHALAIDSGLDQISSIGLGNNVTINTYGDRSHGVAAVLQNNAGAATVYYSVESVINTRGEEAHGINVSGSAGPIPIMHTGNIDVFSLNSITVGGENAKGIFIDSLSGNSTINVIAEGTIEAKNKNAGGIYIQNIEAASTGTGTNTITINKNTIVHGGSDGQGSAVTAITDGNQIITNRGILQAESDRALVSTIHGANRSLSLENEGTIVGFMTVSGGAASATINNHVSGIVDLKNSGGGVITNQFSLNNTTFNNDGVIRLHQSNYNGAISTDARFVGVTTFNHNPTGVIQLSSQMAGTKSSGPNDVAGDTLTIDGNFVANGGSIVLDTYLDDASSNGGLGTSDRLILTNTSVGANGAAQLYINTMPGSPGGVTLGNGIQVVSVAGTSAAGAFALAHDVFADAYQYQLHQVGGSWYLSNTVDPNTLTPGGGVTPGLPNIVWPFPGGGYPGLGGGGYIPIYRPDAGVELANRENVIEMMVPGLAGTGAAPNGISGSGAMRSSIRLGHSSKGVDGTVQGQKSNTLWSFATATDSHGKAANGQLRYSGESYVLQVGGDRTFEIGNGLLQAGLMAHMSTSKTRSRNLITGATARGDSDGYGLGAYATWYFRSNDVLSPFIDTYFIYGRYKNSVKTRNNRDYSYRSNAFSFTVQGGYPIGLTQDWILEPQAQITYVKYNSQHHQDHLGTNIHMSTKGNFVGRVGTYIYGSGYKVQPYGAVNVWYDGTQSQMRYNVDGGAVKADKRGAIFEMKMGFQTQPTNNLTLWGEISGRKGQNSYRDYGGAVGIKYAW